VLAEQATARNRAMLWVLFETGMRASEVCALRLSDVDREQGILRVGGGKAQSRDGSRWGTRGCATCSRISMTIIRGRRSVSSGEVEAQITSFSQRRVVLSPKVASRSCLAGSGNGLA